MPDPRELLAALEIHQSADATESEMRNRMLAFVTRHMERSFSRATMEGHITASCWVVDAGRTQTLLCWHGKLDRWLQMGGHIEDDPTLLQSALRELREESGLTRFAPLRETIFDVDVHFIPARPAKPNKPAEPEHFHYDVRFLIEADPSDPLTLSEESRELAWVALDRIDEYTDEESVLRMVRKTQRLTPTDE